MCVVFEGGVGEGGSGGGVVVRWVVDRVDGVIARLTWTNCRRRLVIRASGLN